MKKAEVTRRTILEKSYELIYTKGYQTTSIDDILATTQMTKGAFYYHFKNKDEMGVAIINEILKPSELKSTRLFAQATELDALEKLYKIMYHLLIEEEDLTVEHGCPISNLIQEMTPWNENFKKALAVQVQEWEKQFISIIEEGQAQGIIRAEIQAERVVTYILSGYFGIRNFGKLKNSKLVYIDYLKELKNYLDNLR